MLRKISVMVAGVKTSVTEDKLTLKANGDYEKHYNADMTLDVVTIEAEVLAEVANIAKQYLASTDWYVSRKAESGKPIPDDVLAKRIEARNSIK